MREDHRSPSVRARLANRKGPISLTCRRAAVGMSLCVMQYCEKIFETILKLKSSMCQHSAVLMRGRAN